MTAPVNRRALLGGCTAGALLFGAAGPGKAAELDGELLAACAEFQRVDAECGRFDALEDASDEECLAAGEPWLPALGRVLACPSPRTPEGLRAKASAAFLALKRAVEIGPDYDWRTDASGDVLLAMHTLRDLVGEG